MMKEGHEVRMVSRTNEGSSQSGGYNGGQGAGRGSWHGGRAGRGLKVYTCFSCGKEGHFIANFLDKVIPKETPDINLISSTISANAVTRSQRPLLMKDVIEE